MASRYLLESSLTDGYLLEDGSGVLLLEGTDPVPNVQTDWPNPRLPRVATGANRSVDLLTWTSGPLKQNLVDTTKVLRSPLYTKIEPRGYPVSLRTWAQGDMPLLRTVAKPFAQTDWPNPRGAVPPINLKTWTKSRNLGTDTFFGLAGHPTFNWPNPRGYVPSIDLKTWTDRRVGMIGQDRFFGLAGHPTFDWPVPKGYVPATDLKTWVQGFNFLTQLNDVFTVLRVPLFTPRGVINPKAVEIFQNLLTTTLGGGVAQAPFSLADWPNPRGSVGAQQPIINPFNPNLVPTPPAEEQLRQIIRFAPLAFGGRTHWTR